MAEVVRGQPSRVVRRATPGLHPLPLSGKAIAGIRRRMHSLVAVLWIVTAGSADHAQHHATHNMVLYGDRDVFASHLVYKAPHNFQIILQIQLDPQTRKAYLDERRRHPMERVVLLLDPMPIRDITEAPVLTGTLLRRPEKGPPVVLRERIRLERKNVKLILLNELPLSLEAT
jgi:hypothetical protein